MTLTGTQVYIGVKSEINHRVSTLSSVTRTAEAVLLGASEPMMID